MGPASQPQLMLATDVGPPSQPQLRLVVVAPAEAPIWSASDTT